MSEVAPEVEAEDEQVLVEDADQEPEGPAVGSDGFPVNTPVADMAPEHQAAYWRHHARAHEKRAKAFGQYSPDQVKAMADRIAEIEDSQKTEQQRLADRLAAAEQRAQQAEIGRARLMAAATYNVPASMLDRIGGSTEDEINEAAEAIAAEINAAVEAEMARRLAAMPAVEPDPEPVRPSRTRPVESLTPGGMPDSGDHVVDGNAFLRRMAGRSPY